jgi:hypothetical protein
MSARVAPFTVIAGGAIDDWSLDRLDYIVSIAKRMRGLRGKILILQATPSSVTHDRLDDLRTEFAELVRELESRVGR